MDNVRHDDYSAIASNHILSSSSFMGQMASSLPTGIGVRQTMLLSPEERLVASPLPIIRLYACNNTKTAELISHEIWYWNILLKIHVLESWQVGTNVSEQHTTSILRV
jgi:hypothetical protein